jgi:hypothetical protein
MFASLGNGRKARRLPGVRGSDSNRSIEARALVARQPAKVDQPPFPGERVVLEFIGYSL